MDSIKPTFRTAHNLGEIHERASETLSQVTQEAIEDFFNKQKDKPIQEAREYLSKQIQDNYKAMQQICRL